MSKDLLGELEHQVLLAVLRLGSDAYSASIVTELEERTGRDVAPAAVYIALRRLEEKGMAASDMRRPEDGPRERRYFTVTDGGRSILRESRRRLARLWEGMDAAMEERA
jgi:PadR family transcriptional regulator, regulatory protein PadR